MVRRPEGRQQNGTLDEEPSPHIAVDVVAELVGQHRLDLVGGELGDQRVEEKDPSGPAEARQGRVCRAALPGLVCHPHADHCDADALGQRQQPLLERRVLQRDQPVEERDDPDRDHHRQEERAGEEDQSGPEPPPRGDPEKPIDDLEGDQGQRAADQTGLQPVPEPAAKGLVEEAEAFRQPIAPRPVQRQGQEPHAGAERDGEPRHVEPPGKRRGRSPPREPSQQDRREAGDREEEARQGKPELPAVIDRGLVVARPQVRAFTIFSRRM